MTSLNTLLVSKIDTIENALAEIRTLLASTPSSESADIAQPKADTGNGTARLPEASFLVGTLGESLARRHINHRMALIKTFGPELMADPVWTMLLELLLAHYHRTNICVSSLCIASGVPSTTALRWLAIMQERGLIERWPDTNDRRRIYVRITEHGLSQVLAHLAEA